MHTGVILYLTFDAYVLCIWLWWFDVNSARHNDDKGSV